MIVVNLFGAPSCGKSTGAAHIFSELKLLGVNCELITEFAKDLTWEQRYSALSNQLYVSGVQAERLNKLKDKVDVVVTDSPLFLGTIYNTPQNNNFDKVILDEFNKYNNMNFLVNRVKPYNPNGRNQTEKGSNEIQQQIKQFTTKYSIPYIEVDGDKTGYKQVIDDVMDEWCDKIFSENTK